MGREWVTWAPDLISVERLGGVGYMSGPCYYQASLRLTKTKLNSVALVRERTIPTERPPPVGEVSAKFCG